MSDRVVPMPLRGAAGLGIGLILFLLLIALAWVGFLGSDDVTYARGAYGWIEQFPYVGGHGTIRYPLTIPMALSFVALGGNEFAMVLPSLIYAAGLLGFLWWLVRRAAGEAEAFGALLILATSPLLVIQSSIANVEMVEAFFLFASVGTYWRCLDEGASAKRLLFAGVMAGCAFLTRETAIFVAVFYGLLFLAGHGFHRGHYLWIAAGFLILWSVELLYLAVMTGDPFYRLNISLNHDPTIDRGVDLAGNVIVHPAVDPALVLLLNQEFMLLFFLAVPLGAWLCFGKAVEGRTRHFARIIALLGLVWFLCAAAAQSLLPLNPRYFMITAAAACILSGIALVRLLRSQDRFRRLAAVGAALALLSANAVGILVENKNPRFGERMLADLAAAPGSPVIVTDPMTRYRADLLLRWGGDRARVKDAPPRSGDLFLYNPANAAAANFRLPASRLADYQPLDDWPLVASFRPAPSIPARALATSGLAGALPAKIWDKLRNKDAEVRLYRVGEPRLADGGSGPQPQELASR